MKPLARTQYQRGLNENVQIVQALQRSGKVVIGFHALLKTGQVALLDDRFGCGAKPIGNLLDQPRPGTTIEHQMNPRLVALVSDAMGTRQVEKPAFTPPASE